MATRLFAQARSVREAEGIVTLIAKTYRHIGSKLYGVGFYHHSMIDCICSHAVNHPTFIDIGAHIGLITTAVADRFNYYLAVEPAPANLARLQQAVSSRKLENCRVVPCALGEREGFAALHLSEVSNGDHTLARRDDLTRSITVPVTTLDLLIEESKVAGPFFIKIDVQGYELMVFLGGERTLAGECMVISEFWPWGLKSASCNATDYLEFMQANGYTACELTGLPLSERKLDRLCRLGESDRFVVTDILFRKR